MADNQAMNGTTALIATDEVSYSGDTASVQLMRMVRVTGGEGSKTVVGDALPALLTDSPSYNVAAIPVRAVGASYHDCSFHQVSASLLAPEMTQIALGTGHTVSQAGGALVVASGTTTNSEFLARSVETFDGAFQFSASVIASQRIINNNFAFILGDLIGQGLAYTINSATSITVTLSGHTFTSANVGQFMMIGGLSVAGSVPGRYAIASVVAGTSITFTVAGFPVSGSGTCALFGWSHFKLLHTGTVATAVNFATQRRGWAAADIVATINTTATPGTIEYLNAEVSMAYLVDRARGSGQNTLAASRASISENIPPAETSLYVFLWSYNGTVAPASTTTWTINFWRVEDSSKTAVTIAGVNHMGQNSALPIQHANGVTVGSLPSTPAGANLIGDIAAQTRTGAGGLALPNRLASSAATTNGTVVKATAGRVYKITGYNNTATVRYLKLHNSATVTVGTTPVVNTFVLKPNDYFHIDFGLLGQVHATGICYSITAAIADADATAITAGDILGLNVWFA